MEAGLEEWAESQAHNTGAGPDALREVFKVQMNAIVNDSGKPDGSQVGRNQS